MLLACCAIAAWVALLMMGECTVAKPEASKASDLACTSSRLGRSQPLVATDCRQTRHLAVRQGSGGVGGGGIQHLERGCGDSVSDALLFEFPVS